MRERLTEFGRRSSRHEDKELDREPDEEEGVELEEADHDLVPRIHPPELQIGTNLAEAVPAEFFEPGRAL